MASEYSVNISLDTKKAEAGLKKLRTQINDLNKPARTTKTTRQEEKISKLKEAQRVSMVQTRKIGDQVQRAADLGLKVDKARAAIRRAAKADSAGLVKLADANRKSALSELKINQEITKEKAKQINLQRQMASPIGGLRTMMGSPTQLGFAGSGMGRSPIRGTSTQFGSPAFFDAAARAGGARSPILGSKTTFGSPKFFEASAKAGGPSIPIKGSKDIFGSPAYYEATNKEALRIAKANAMPIKGFKHLVGSPAYFEDQAKQFKEVSERGGPSSALNFDRRTGKLLRGPAGSGSGGFRNLARRFDTQSALISGAFPLLFGQGPVGALAGGLGGGIGGMFGQMGGFAGGIAGTAIVQQLQNTIAAVSQLGQAFNSINPNIEALTASLGVAGTEEERRLKLIEETQGKQAALAAVTERMNKAIGVDGVENLKRFGETSQLLANAFTLAMTKMQAALAPFFELLATPFVGQIREQKRNEQIAAGGGATDPTLLGLQEELAGIASTKQNRAKRNRLKAQIEARKEELAELGKIEITARNIRMIEDSKLKKIRQQNDLLRAKINGNFEEVQLAQEVEAKIQEMVDAGAKINEIDRQRVEDTLKLNKDLEEQAELAEKIRQSFKDLGQSIATDISDGIKGMIRGTSTLNDLLNNVMDKLIDTAFNMAFFGNPQGTLGGGGLFGSIFSGLGSIFGGGGLPSSQVLGQRASAMTGIPMNLPAGSFANGGNPPVGRASLVGERGPELFVPNRAGTIIPNHALGGTTNVVVNVDASGSSVEGDEEQGRELGRMISAAIQSELIKQKRPGGMLA